MASGDPVFIKQIAKASKILVADSAPPYTMCEYNLNFPKKIMDKITFVGHFTNKKNISKEIYSVAGGGDTVSLINSLEAIDNFDFVSTAGGAFLEYLEGKDLPGIKVLN